jgi:hypothetical protein
VCDWAPLQHVRNQSRNRFLNLDILNDCCAGVDDFEVRSAGTQNISIAGISFVDFMCERCTEEVLCKGEDAKFVLTCSGDKEAQTNVWLESVLRDKR